MTLGAPSRYMSTFAWEHVRQACILVSVHVVYVSMFEHHYLYINTDIKTVLDTLC